MRHLFNRARSSRMADILVFAAIVFVILIILRILPQLAPLKVTGQARLIDGDSLFVNGVELRLEGIDAPEAAQNCTRAGKSWPCGRDASRALGRLLRGSAVRCEGARRDAHDRVLAICRLGDMNINRWMVEQGWAVSFHAYPGEERSARLAKKGIWSGTFVRPREWREENR